MEQHVAHSIIICDDEPHVTQLMELMLSEAGFEVRIAPHGRRAFELACEAPPDLIITDFQMPLMNGLELALRLRERTDTAAVPVIMLTSRSHRVDPELLAQTSIAMVVPKPFSPRDVTAKAISLLEDSAERRAA